MKMKSISFPKLQIILIFFLFTSFSCQKEEPLIINKEQFIEFYARLLIINELKVKKEIRDRLMLELYSENNITTTNVDSTVSYYNSNPNEWVDVCILTREKIQGIKTDLKKEFSDKIDSLLSKPRKNLPGDSYRNDFRNSKKEILDQRKKSKKKTNTKIDNSKDNSD